MSDQPATPEHDPSPTAEDEAVHSRRVFLQGMGKWSGAAILAAVAGLSMTTEASAGAWVNRRGGGGWVNRAGGWINGGGGGGSWINAGGGGGGWVNRRGGGGSWINRR